MKEGPAVEICGNEIIGQVEDSRTGEDLDTMIEDKVEDMMIMMDSKLR